MQLEKFDESPKQPWALTFTIFFNHSNADNEEIRPVVYLANRAICIIVNTQFFFSLHIPTTHSPINLTTPKKRGVALICQALIYTAQLGTDGKGNKSQFSFPCVINTSNDPQLGSGRTATLGCQIYLLTQHFKVPARWPHLTWSLMLLRKSVLQIC